MLTPATPVSIEEYLAYNGKPNCEYLHGVMRPKALGTRKHGQVQHRIANRLEQLGYDSSSELTVRIAEDFYLVPDVAADTQMADPYPDRPVLLCVEILSPDDRMKEMLSKCDSYHEWGAPYCWVVDPEKERAWEYHRGGSPVEITSTLRAGDIAISLSEVFLESR